MLWAWEPQKVGCGWYNGSVMIWDVALVEKKRNTVHKVRKFIHITELLSTVSYWWKYMHNIFFYYTSQLKYMQFTTLPHITWTVWSNSVKTLVSKIQNAVILEQIELLLWLLPSGTVTVNLWSRIPMSLTLHTTEIWLNTDTDSGGMKDRTHGIFLQKVTGM